MSPRAAPVADLSFFSAPVRAWFGSAFDAPTAVQAAGWPAIARGEHALLLAPTGAGKTLAAFLWCIDALSRQPAAERRGSVRVLYVSPLKALAYDVERNLRAPLAGVAEQARRLGEAPQVPRVAIRSGDTPQRDRRRQARDPAEILVTTPESLYLILTSAARETLRGVDMVTIDEVHALAPTKRGAHLALSLERLSLLTDRDPQRIGLSATARPAVRVAPPSRARWCSLSPRPTSIRTTPRCPSVAPKRSPSTRGCSQSSPAAAISPSCSMPRWWPRSRPSSVIEPIGGWLRKRTQCTICCAGSGRSAWRRSPRAPAPRPRPPSMR